jgi:opacity protein-like surface antigen
MKVDRRRLLGLLDRAVIGAILLLAMVLLGVQVAKASTEIIPSAGVTKPMEGDDKVKGFGGLALRTDLLPLVKTELGISYRSEDRLDDRLHVRMWPVTASLWLAPIPQIYAGGGVGWYHTTFDYDQDKIPFPISDETTQKFGVHLGGGLQFPVAPSAGLDLHGRYVMMRDQDSRLIPEKFKADFWQSSLGLAIRF